MGLHSYTITLLGEPIAKKRPRFNIKTGRVYDCQYKESKSVKMMILSELVRLSKTIPIKNAVSLDITFYKEPPKSISKKKRLQLIGTPDLRKPDLDNYLKFILDCSNGIVFEDDRQVYKIISEKIYAEESKIEMEISVWK